nr:MAG TPA: hypothetical protein [Caudoviricetes sp.]
MPEYIVLSNDVKRLFSFVRKETVNYYKNHSTADVVKPAEGDNHGK